MGMSGKASFCIKAIPETTSLTGPDPAQLSKIPTDTNWKAEGSSFSRPTDNDVCKIKRSFKEDVKALNPDELPNIMFQNISGLNHQM